MADIDRAVEALKGKAGTYAKLWQYYDGDQPLVYSARRLQDLFRNIDARFSENWISVIVDSAADRLDLARYTVSGDPAATDRLNQLWTETQMDQDEDTIHLAALVTGEAYVIGWRDMEGEAIECYYNRPAMCHLQYDPERPRRRLWGAKWWRGDDDHFSLTMYYPDHLDYYRASTASKTRPPENAKAFEQIGNSENPFGVIPMYHIRANWRTIRGELSQSILELQDGINKLLNDMFVTAEFAAFRQRYIISDADVSNLKNAPNEIWRIPAGDGVGQPTAVGEFGQTDLSGYLEAINHLAVSMGVISRTPKSFFVKLPTHEISGEALMALEAPLIKKVSRYIKLFTPTWREIAAFLLYLDGIEIRPERIKPEYRRPETIQPRTLAEIRQINVGAGIPLISSLRDEGRTQAEIDQIQQDREAESLASADLATAYLDQARRELAQERSNGDGTE